MSKQLWSPLRETTSKETLVAGKPNHRTRHLLIANGVRDVIGDYGDLARGRQKPMFKKQLILPPMTAAYRQTQDLLQVDKIRVEMEREIVKCEMNDIERQRLIKEVLGKCEKLEDMYNESENALATLHKRQETQKQILRAVAKEEKAHCMVVKRYLKAGESLVKLGEIIRDKIEENKCYYEFIEEASGGSGIRSIGQFLAKYENCESFRKTLTQRMSESLERAETLKADLLMKKEQFLLEQSFHLGRLQALTRDTAGSKIMNARLENSLTNANVESVAHVTMLNTMLLSARHMIENLIHRKVIGKRFRKKTLAQQIEVIRQDYVKRKAIIHEYERGKEMIDQKRSKRLALYNEFSKSKLESMNHARTLADLGEKKRMKAVAMRYSAYIKSKKGRKKDNEEEEVYDPLMDKSNIVKMIDCCREPSFYDEDYQESSDDDLDGIDKLDSDSENLDNLNRSSNIISSPSEHVVPGRNQALAFSGSVSSTASSVGMGSSYSYGSAVSFSGIGTDEKSNSFLKQNREISLD